MAALSPAISNDNTVTTHPFPPAAATTAAATAATATTAAATATATAITTTNASKNLRGLNKPKCIKCGNVARSRCPYQSCKNCCAKALNPCHIHVLKTNATFPDKTPSSSSSLFDQQSTEASSSGNSHRFTSLRQLSNNFAQFNNLQSPLRSRKPLTRKEAAVINEWRLRKLKEFKEGNIEVENEAFDRYMQNISLLEEVLTVNSTPEEPTNDGSPTSNPNPTFVGDSAEMVAAGLKLKRRSNSTRTENLTKRVQDVVNQGLRKLRKIDSNNGGNDPNKQDELVGKQEKGKSRRAERASALTDLLDKLNKAQNEEDLKSCLEMKPQLFNQHLTTSEMETEVIKLSKQETAKNEFSPGLQSDYSLPKWFCTANVDQDVLNHIDVHFSSLEEIEAL